MSEFSDLYTIIYYSSNREKPDFEQRIIKKLLEVKGDIPVVSVTQKPMDLGFNVCIGDVGASDINLHHQIEIGCLLAKTPFVISAEADCLYPPDYFRFKPVKVNECYIYENLYVLSRYKEGFKRKTHCYGAQITGREYYIEEIRKSTRKKPMWGSRKSKDKGKIWKKFRKYKRITSVNPVVTIKTGHGMRTRTPADEVKYFEIPYWGKYEDMKKEWLG